MNSTVATRATEIVLPGKVEPGGLQVRSTRRRSGLRNNPPPS
jgi:hypothetical protein